MDAYLVPSFRDETYIVSSNFFEMVRFDFVVDDDMNVFLMEVSVLLKC